MKTKYIYEFLRNKNLYEECEKYCKEHEEIEKQEQKTKPISKRQFAWKEYHTKNVEQIQKEMQKVVKKLDRAMNDFETACLLEEKE